MFPKIMGTPKSSILIGFSIIFTIHFGGNILFLETPICVGVGILETNFAKLSGRLSPSYLLSGPAAGMTPEEEADQVLRQVVGGP